MSPIHPRSQVLTRLVAEQLVAVVAAANDATTAIAGLAGLGCGEIAIAAQDGPLFPSSVFPPPLSELPAAAVFFFLFFLQGRKGLKTFNRIV